MSRGRCNDAANASFVIDSAPALCGMATYVPIAFYLTLYSMLFYIAGRWARGGHCYMHVIMIQASA